MKRILGLIDDINEYMGRVTSFLILILTGILCWEVLLRGIFNAPTIWAHESTAFFFGAYFMVGGAYALRHHAHVNVDVLYTRFPPRARAVIDLITSALFFIFVGVLIWKGFDLMVVSIGRVEHSMTTWGPPLYPLKIMIVVGTLFVLIQGIAKFIRDLILATTGRGPA